MKAALLVSLYKWMNDDLLGGAVRVCIYHTAKQTADAIAPRKNELSNKHTIIRIQ